MEKKRTGQPGLFLSRCAGGGLGGRVRSPVHWLVCANEEGVARLLISQKKKRRRGGKEGNKTSKVKNCEKCEKEVLSKTGKYKIETRRGVRGMQQATQEYLKPGEV